MASRRRGGSSKNVTKGSKKEKVKQQLPDPCRLIYNKNALGTDAYQKAVIKKVLITGLPTDGRTADGKITLHWRITLEGHEKDNENKLVSITVEEMPNRKKGFDHPPNIIFDLKSYLGHSQSALKDTQFDFNISNSITLRFENVTQLIQSRNLDKFLLAPDGNGCFHWIQEVSEDMIGQNWFDDASKKLYYQTVKAIQPNTTYENGKYVCVLAKGTFWAR